MDAMLMILLCKKIIVSKSKEMKSGWSKSSKKGYGSKRSHLPPPPTTIYSV
jgi:hypothetical protein